MPVKVKIGARYSANEVKDDCELTCGCWELNTCPQEKQQVFLTPELPLQLLILTLNGNVIYDFKFMDCRNT